MTLDEAITHSQEIGSSCDSFCAKEHKQLAEWLIDYKRLLIKEGYTMEWNNNIAMTEQEEQIVKALWKAGCKCAYPLIGYIPDEGYRCRVCNTEPRLIMFYSKWEE